MGISRLFVNSKFLINLLDVKSKGVSIIFLLFFLLFQNWSAQEQGVIYVTGDAKIVGFEENVNIIIHENKDENIHNSNKAEEKVNINKKRIVKKTEISTFSKRKQVSNKVNTRPKDSFQNTKSDQSIVLTNGLNHNGCSITNPTFNYKGVLEFHYKILNTPIHIHLEKSYDENFILSSTFSKFFFSRPPPTC